MLSNSCYFYSSYSHKIWSYLFSYYCYSIRCLFILLSFTWKSICFYSNLFSFYCFKSLFFASSSKDWWTLHNSSCFSQSSWCLYSSSSIYLIFALYFLCFSNSHSKSWYLSYSSYSYAHCSEILLILFWKCLRFSSAVDLWWILCYSISEHLAVNAWFSC